MRKLLLALAVLALAAAPSMAFINVQLIPAAQEVARGGSVEVQLQVFVDSNPDRGIGIVAGNVGANNALVSVSGLSWIAQMQNTTSPAQAGAADGTGGWDGFAATQAVPNNASLALLKWDTVLTLTVQAGMVPGVTHLTFENVGVINPLTGQPRNTSSLSLGGIPAKFDTLVQDVTGCDITVTPEPATMVLLALGGLMIARRRR